MKISNHILMKLSRPTLMYYNDLEFNLEILLKPTFEHFLNACGC